MPTEINRGNKVAFTIRTNCLRQKKLHVGVAERWMFILVLLATLLRLFLICSNWPTTTSDESVIDLMALHINTKGEFPIFFYGQYYMGALEAYLGALAIHLFGPTIFSVRLGLLLLFASYLICMYHLTRLLYNEKFALVSVAFLGLGSSIVTAQQLRAIGGYPEILLSGALMYLITVWLLLTSYPSQRIYSLEQQRWRMLLYSLLGLVMGFALYTDQLILPCIAISGVLLLLFCWRDFIHWAGFCFLVGLLIGMLPLIIYNVHAAPGEDSLHVLLRLQQGSTGYTRANHITFVQQIIGAFMIALPAETGYNPLCDDKEYLPRLRSVGDLFPKGQQFQCTLEHGSWSLGISILWGVALLLAMRSIWRQWRQAPAKVWSHEERQNVVLQTARSMLLIGAALTFVLYVLNPSPAFQPLGTVRYLICLLLALPVILWPLWHGISIDTVARVSSKWRAPAGFVCRMGILLFLAITFVRGSIDALTGIPAAQTANAQQERLIHELLQLGARHVYSDYDTCNPLIFQSHEQIICSSLQIHGQQLQLGLNRYPPYLDLMKLTPHPTYVYRLNSPEIVFLGQGAYRFSKHYQRIVFSGYVVYIYRMQTRSSSA